MFLATISSSLSFTRERMRHPKAYTYAVDLTPNTVLPPNAPRNDRQAINRAHPHIRAPPLLTNRLDPAQQHSCPGTKITLGYLGAEQLMCRTCIGRGWLSAVHQSAHATSLTSSSYWMFLNVIAADSAPPSRSTGCISTIHWYILAEDA